MAAQSPAYTAYDAGIGRTQSINVGGGDVPVGGTRGLYIGGAGNISVTFVGDAAPVVLIGIAAGVWHPMQLQSINQTSTTATGIVAGF